MSLCLNYNLTEMPFYGMALKLFSLKSRVKRMVKKSYRHITKFVIFCYNYYSFNYLSI